MRHAHVLRRTVRARVATPPYAGIKVGDASCVIIRNRRIALCDAHLIENQTNKTNPLHSKMKAILIATCFIGCMTIVNAQLLTAAAIVIGAKILIGKGFIYGAAKGTLARNIASGNRGKREADPSDFNAILLEQNKRDVDDCAKFLICHLNSKPLNKLDVSCQCWVSVLMHEHDMCMHK
jgi:hypothetical protein